MTTLRVLTDGPGRAWAEQVAARLVAAGHGALLRELPRFPIADGLPALLHTQAAAADAVVVVLAPGSPNRAWVLAELGLPGLYERVFLAIETEAERPQWAAGERRRVLVGPDELPTPGG